MFCSQTSLLLLVLFFNLSINFDHTAFLARYELIIAYYQIKLSIIISCNYYTCIKQNQKFNFLKSNILELFCSWNLGIVLCISNLEICFAILVYVFRVFFFLSVTIWNDLFPCWSIAIMIISRPIFFLFQILFFFIFCDNHIFCLLWIILFLLNWVFGNDNIMIVIFLINLIVLR